MLNPYFNRPQTGYGDEWRLYNSMIIECIQQTGVEVIYIPRSINKMDFVFGEDVLSSFDSHAVVEMYLEDIEGYGGESEMLSKFGMEIRDTATFVVSRDRFHETVSPIFPASRNDMVKDRPCEGDLLYFPLSKSLWEIKFVEDEYPHFYQLHKKYVWSLRCELTQLNNERFQTGHTEVDEYFGETLNRLDRGIGLEDVEGVVLTEDGGYLLDESYVESKPYDEIRGYGDEEAIRKEFLEIIDFTQDNPFNERF